MKRGEIDSLKRENMARLRGNSQLPQNTKVGDKFQVVKSFYGDLIYLEGVVTSIPPHRRFGVVTYGDGIRESWPIERAVIGVLCSDHLPEVQQIHRQETEPPKRKRKARRRVPHSWQKKLRPFRESCGMRQSDMADRLNVPTDTYGNWERCTRTAPMWLHKVFWGEMGQEWPEQATVQGKE